MSISSFVLISKQFGDKKEVKAQNSLHCSQNETATELELHAIQFSSPPPVPWYDFGISLPD